MVEANTAFFGAAEAKPESLEKKIRRPPRKHESSAVVSKNLIEFDMVDPSVRDGESQFSSELVDAASSVANSAYLQETNQKLTNGQIVKVLLLSQKGRYLPYYMEAIDD